MDRAVLDAVATIVRKTVGLDERRSLSADTALLGMPELDSLAIVELAMAIEQQFSISIDSEDFNADLFETLGTLAAYVAERTGAARGLEVQGTR